MILTILIFDYIENNLNIKIKKELTNCIYYFIYNPIIYIENFFKNIKDVFILNKKLININDNLNKKIISDKINKLEYENCKKENIELKKILNINILKKYKYNISKILYYNHVFSRLIIDKGIDENIHIGQPVLNYDGIIGYISLSNKNNSYVNLIYKSKSKISLKNSRNGIIFIAKGSGINGILLCKNFNIILNNTDDFKEGDLLVSSGLDDLYPKNYPVGYISKIIKNKNNYYLDIEIKTLFNINNINYIVILK
ncbi:hypothetical protein Nrd_0580 [endosymbiont of Pachyrhynchus infernalis]|nr:cell shape-determining protein MreC [endosymbiont of Pachyrhynchus infernalis]